MNTFPSREEIVQTARIKVEVWVTIKSPIKLLSVTLEELAKSAVKVHKETDIGPIGKLKWAKIDAEAISVLESQITEER